MFKRSLSEQRNAASWVDLASTWICVGYARCCHFQRDSPLLVEDNSNSHCIFLVRGASFHHAWVSAVNLVSIDRLYA